MTTKTIGEALASKKGKKVRIVLGNQQETSPFFSGETLDGVVVAKSNNTVTLSRKEIPFIAKIPLSDIEKVV